MSSSTLAGLTRYATTAEAHDGAAVDAAVTPPSLLMRKKANGAIIGGDMTNYSLAHGGNSLVIAPVSAATAAGQNAVAVGANSSAGISAVAVGSGSTADDSGTALGSSSYAASLAVAVGRDSQASGANALAFGKESTASAGSAVAIGDNSSCSGDDSVAIGSYAATGGASAIQLGLGANYDANTFQVFSYRLLETTGKIPPDRYMVAPPATAISPGEPGQIAYDANYIYICVAINTWRRAALSAW